MMELLAVSVGIGLVVGVASSELLGLASAGLIVPGYLALHLMSPWHLLATMAVAFATYGVVSLIASFFIVHGRRRMALMILVGYLLGMLLTESSGVFAEDFTTIGFVIPGLIAAWMDRQGTVPTLSSLLLVTVAVRLILILTGAELGT